jgi:L-alanine-DL-glutamate epimerase-like enolase superfamily enzyme
MAADARYGISEGYHSIKLKVGRKLEDDVLAVRAVAGAVGKETPLRLDANMAWKTVPDAARAMRALADEGMVAWFEQPLRRHNLDGMRLLRNQTGIPVMADEALQTLHDAYQAARNEAADVWNVYVSEAGGLRAAADIFALAAALDVPCIIGSQAEMGIGTAAAAHLAVSLPNISHPCETFGPVRYQKDIVRESPRIENGFLYASDAPGLGVELDEDTVREFEVPLA